MWWVFFCTQSRKYCLNLILENQNMLRYENQLHPLLKHVILTWDPFQLLNYMWCASLSLAIGCRAKYAKPTWDIVSWMLHSYSTTKLDLLYCFAIWKLGGKNDFTVKSPVGETVEILGWEPATNPNVSLWWQAAKKSQVLMHWTVKYSFILYVLNSPTS